MTLNKPPVYGILVLLSMLACKSGSTSIDKDIDVDPYPDWDSGGSSTDSQADTHVPEDTSSPPDKTEEWEELDELWRDCRGTLHITTDAFTWVDAEPSCAIGGSASLEEGLLTLVVATAEDCESIPWWLNDDEPVVHGYEIVGARLTLVPQDLQTSGGAKQMLTKQFAQGDVDRQRWEMLSSDGDASNLDICFLPDGPFYGGMYYATDDRCNFFSCGGSATGTLKTEDSFSVYTACAGDCPCVGILYADEVSDESLSGTWAGANCSRTMEGEFTATRGIFPDSDL
jgi:hypothetical protein